MFRFLHTADLHLDAPLKSLALRDPDLAELVGNATRRALGRIVEIAVAERVDAVLVAGDLYDGDLRSMKTAAFLVAEFARLEAAGIRVFLIRGNHDAASVLTTEISFPENVHVFAGRGGSVEIPERGVAIHGVGFERPEAPESLLPRFAPPVPGLANIGLLHTSLAGAAGHDTYAPVSAAELAAHGYDYWALGHVHVRKVHSEGPWIVMPGMPQGRDVGEAGPKSVTLATVTETGIALEERVTSVVEFRRESVGLDGIEDWREALAATAPVLEAASKARSEHVVLRLTLTGETPLVWRLRRDADLLAAELGERARAAGGVWIEKVELDVRAPGAAKGGDEALEEIGRLMAGLPDDPVFMARAQARAAALIDELPPEMRDAFGESEADRETILRKLLGTGVETMVARMLAGEGEA